MENILYNELISRGFSVDVGVVEYNHTNAEGKKLRSQLEVDFVVNKTNMRYYIQSALSIADLDKAVQEVRPLLAVKDFFQKIIVTKTSMKPWIDEKGVQHVGLYDFLLQDDVLN